ncbi:zinc-binding dehydrogenase [Colwellia sp. M166]|uniref:alcohol dehydrogenase family protein n=1 Tax=Colwellia sp. M166 TaxID=2583805 RepID=UPI00211E19DB|nr:alcohol dehydrogenase family protein [Colwellia sp. M166]UUO21953.1 zinc-binding dehydrogenase [Colwellia sp. M166]|tara:strand:+ start:20695 stop:21744 length:1050 start_codon:yes stop_codon:yes gene_type:complete
MFKIPETMKGVQLTGHGGSEVLQYRDDITVPRPKHNEVLIRVAAAGVNNTDINTRIAWYSKSDNNGKDASWSGNALIFPRIQGADVCGVIVAVGNGVDNKRIGERVLVEPCLREANGQELETPWYFGSECDGGFAEFSTVSSVHAYPIKSELSDIELATFPCSYSTAENMLTRTKVTSKDKVLITGASGGVGSAAIQLAKARGAYVIAVTSPEKKHQLIDLGADEVVFRDENLVTALGSNSVDVVIDLVAGKQWPLLLDVLKIQGRYAVSGAIGGALVELDVRTLYLKDLSFYGCTVLEPEVFQNLINCIEQQKIIPIVALTLPLEGIYKAQAVFQKKQHVGKIVLTVK